MVARSRRGNRIEAAVGTHSQFATIPDAPLATGTSDCDGSPLTWWRRRSAKDYSASDIQTLRSSLRKISECEDEQWPRAVKGDGDAAIGVAVRIIWRGQEVGVTRDAAMSAVLACALEHDAAAIVLLAAVLDRDAKRHSADKALTDSWLLYSVSNPSMSPPKRGTCAAGFARP